MKKLITVILVFISLIQINAQRRVDKIYLSAYSSDFRNTNHLLKTPNLPATEIRTSHSFLNISGQLLAGTFMSLGLTFTPMMVEFGYSFRRHQSDLINYGLSALIVSSYLIGGATGVYWAASSENTKLSFWKTAGYSAIGAGVGVIVIAALSTKYLTIPDAGIIFAIMSPAIGSMVYTNFIADWPVRDANISYSNEIHSHKDLLEYSKVFEITLVKINL